MTAITTARPTMVRTRLLPPAPTCAAASWPPSSPRFRDVCSPFAAAAAAGRSGTPRRAPAQAGKSAGIRITEGDPGWGSPWLSAVPPPALPPVFEPQLVHDRAAQQDDR